MRARERSLRRYYVETYQIDFVLKSNAQNARVPVRRILSHPETKILVREPEQPTINNGLTIAILTFPMSPRHHKSGSATRRF